MAPFRWSPGTATLLRTEALPEGVFEITVTHVRRGLRVSGAPVVSEELIRRIRRMFQLDLELSEFHAQARGIDTHDWVRASGFGRLLCGSTRWEDAVKIITTTNTTWRQTVRMVELLVATCGRGGAFPEPHDLLRFSEEELQRVCRLGYRAKTIRALAAGIENGEIDLAVLAAPEQSSEQLFRQFKTLPGIGPYGAAHLLAMEGRHDFIAVDSEFRRFVRERYHQGRHVSDATMLRRYSRWGRWKYLAFWSELWSRHGR